MRDDMPRPQQLTSAEYAEAMQGLEDLDRQERLHDRYLLVGLSVGTGALGALFGFIVGWLGMH